MATMLGSLLISLGLNSGQFTKGMDDAQRELVAFQRQAQRTAGAMKDLGAKMTVGITAPLAAFGGFAVKAASDAAELQSAFDQTFGSLSASMTQWAEDTGDAMGRSTQEMQQMANTFGIFFNQAAPTADAAAKLSREFAILAQDLSSFFNTDPTEALQKLRSGLAGESEPLRDFGVFLTEANVKAKALEMGLVAVGGELSEQNKIMARAALIMDATTTAQGDVARTADGTANRIREARAAFEELQVAIGTKLLPAITPLVTGLTGLITAFTTLPDWVQTSVVVVGGFAAVAGPLIYAAGALSTNLILLGGAFATSGAAATGASAGVTLLAGALRGLLLVGGPVTIALGLLAGAVYLATRRSKEGAQASATLRDQQEKLENIQMRVKTVTEQLAVATGAARREALANAKAIREETKQYLENAKASLAAARAKIATVKAEGRAALQSSMRSTAGAGSGYDPALGQMRRNNARERKAREEYDALLAQAAAAEQSLYVIQQEINRAPPEVSVPTVAADDGKPKPGPSGPSGPSPAEIEREFSERFADDAVRLEMEALQARERLAVGFEERAGLQMDMIALERAERNAQIDASAAELEKSKLTEDQKVPLREQLEAQRQQVAEIYGVAAKVDEQGTIIATANKGLLEQQIGRERLYENEQRIAEAMQLQFDTRRDHLQLDYDLADTQEERQRIASEILALEQEHRRTVLEKIAASKLSTDTERAIAEAQLKTLSALEAKERRASAKANRTETERYLDSVNLSAGQINEAIEGIRIDGLDALNDGLADAMQGVRTLGEVVTGISTQISADLLRIAIRKAIIGPLANMLFGGSESGNALAGLGLGGAHGGGHSGGVVALNGARAMGGPVLAGGTYLVGENGPELFRPSSSGSIVPNHELTGADGSGGRGALAIHLGPGLEAEWLRKAAGQSVEINRAMAPGLLDVSSAKTRRDAARPITPGGATG